MPQRNAPSLGPIATRVLYEDERVRIWDQVIEPGRSIGPHHHALPYALVTVDGGSLEVAPVPGHPAMYGEQTISVEMQSETCDLLPGGAIEDAKNVGDRTYRAILVEFKPA
ncbi:MAG: hypothetical protein R3F35_21540 [Myxococcota bacterium]